MIRTFLGNLLMHVFFRLKSCVSNNELMAILWNNICQCSGYTEEWILGRFLVPLKIGPKFIIFMNSCQKHGFVTSSFVPFSRNEIRYHI